MIIFQSVQILAEKTFNINISIKTFSSKVSQGASPQLLTDVLLLTGIRTLDTLASSLLEYSLRYSLSTRVANYSDSTALICVHSRKTVLVGYCHGWSSRAVLSE